jgi:hypothetical protein
MKIVSIYPGNFQPPTKAHFKVYEQLKRISGKENVFVVTTDRNPVPEAPLNYGDKEQIWVRHGVPDSNIVKVADWKNPNEVLHKFDENLISTVFALNQNESKETLSRDPKRFLPYAGNEGTLQPASKVKYIMPVDDSRIETTTESVHNEITTDDIRKVLGSDKYDSNTKKKFFRFVFGWFDISLYTLISAKFKQAFQSTNTEPQEPQIGVPQQREQTKLSPKVRSSLQKMVREVLGEIMDEEIDEEYDVNINDPSSPDNMTTSVDKAQQKSNPAAQRQALVKQKQALELQSKQNKQQRDQYATTVKNYDQVKKKADRDAIDTVNKQISQPPSTSTTTTSVVDNSS